MDDMYPTSSEFLHTPEQEARDVQDKEQLAKIAQSYPALIDVLALFDEVLAKLNSVDELPVDTKTTALELKATILANQKSVAIIRGIKSSVETMKMRHENAMEAIPNKD